jgi:hypothetical protein
MRAHAGLKRDGTPRQRFDRVRLVAVVSKQDGEHAMEAALR